MSAFPLAAESAGNQIGRQSLIDTARIGKIKKTLAKLRRTTANKNTPDPLSAESIAADIFYVAGDILSSGRGISWTTAFKTIQEAVDAAGEHDVIRIKKGLYPLTTQLVIAKAVYIQGGFNGTERLSDERVNDGDETVLDGQKNTRCLLVTCNAFLEELTIVRGMVSAEDNEYGGGIAITNCSPRIRNCRFRDNMADCAINTYQPGIGGAVYISNGSPLFRDCTFVQNLAGARIFNGTDGRGGAIYNAGGAAVFITCLFNDNYADESGGAVYGKVYLIDCIFKHNNAARSGGAVYALPGSITVASSFQGNRADYDGGGYNGGGTLLDCQFNDNRAMDAGGGARLTTNTLISACTFTHNRVLNDYLQNLGGGALYIMSNTTNLILNSLFYKNDTGAVEPANGGAIYNNGNTLLLNDTFSGNTACSAYMDRCGQGGAIYQKDGCLTLVNCILWANKGAPTEIAADGAPIKANNCDIDQDGFTGSAANLRLDPLFVDAENGDLHLSNASPCIDAGANRLLLLVPQDLEGHKRISNGTGAPAAIVDLGAYEFRR
jgi:predicted outer membrane repeat protein